MSEKLREYEVKGIETTVFGVRTTVVAENEEDAQGLAYNVKNNDFRKNSRYRIINQI